jgi:hypothetical protein
MTMPSIFRHPSLILLALHYPRIFALGFREGRGDTGMTYDDSPWSSRSRAYDTGRDLRRWGRA